MKFISIEEKVPSICQFCFVKQEDKNTICVWSGEFFFDISDGEIISSKEWCAAYVKGKYEDIPGTRGELNFIPESFHDEEGSEYGKT